MIPRTLHMLWLTPNAFPARFQAFRLSWVRNNPEWNFILWRLSDLPYDRFPAVCRDLLIKTNIRWIIKTDIARWLLLYLYGGVYSDTDMECIRPLDGLLDAQAFAGRSYPPNGVGNAVVGCEPRHPLMLEIAMAAADAVPVAGPQTNAQVVGAGVNLAGRMLARCPTIYPVEYFYPWSWKNRKEIDSTHAPAESYAIHYWAGMEPDGWTKETVAKK
jgi:inositol phosphorylceramide mannosyltransferase catalytic subunit